MDVKFIDNTEALAMMLNVMESLDDPMTAASVLYIDLEGVNLCRHGSISLATLLHYKAKHIYVVDITTLGSDAFDYKNDYGMSLREILESDDIIKVFFDVRNDSDALFSLYNIHPERAEDIQLMELASRDFSRRYLHGLARCIRNDAPMTPNEKRQWNNVKEAGNSLFDPQRGGTYAVFNERPLRPELLDYCVQDVTRMPLLLRHYATKLSFGQKQAVRAETAARIHCSQQVDYLPKGLHKRGKTKVLVGISQAKMQHLCPED